jgi:hypothetical protein
MTKDDLMRESIKTLRDPKVSEWYGKNLEGHDQGDTVKDLWRGVERKEITVVQALHIALVCGYQWNLKFEGVD